MPSHLSKHLQKVREHLDTSDIAARSCKWCNVPIPAFGGFDCDDCRELLQLVILKPDEARKMLEALK